MRSYEKVTINVAEPWMKENNIKSLYVESIDQENKTKYSIGILIITKTKKIKQNIPLAFSSFIHFTPAFFVGRVAEAKTFGSEISHGFQQPPTVLMDPHQDGPKQGRRCNHATWSSVYCLVAFSWVYPAGLSMPIFRRAFWSRGLTTVLRSRYSEKGLHIQGFTNLIVTGLLVVVEWNYVCYVAYYFVTFVSYTTVDILYNVTS